MRTLPLIATVSMCSLALAATPTTMPANPDQKFMVAAAGDGLKEVALGRLAAQQASDPAVRDCGKMMIADHTTVNDQLLTIAMQENVSPPKDLSAAAQATYDKLAALHGAAFDKAFLDAMADDHKDDIKEYQEEADHGHDATVQDFAKVQLPLLHHHLDMIQRLTAR